MNDDEKKMLFEGIGQLLSIYDRINPLHDDGTFDASGVRQCIMEMSDGIMQNSQEACAFKEWMGEKSDFMKSPASTHFHGNVEGGLAAHSLKVLHQSLCFARPVLENFWQCKLKDSYSISAEDIFVSAIAHDFCKADTYRIEYRNQKDIFGNWKKVPNYRTRSDSRNLGHGNESVLRLLELMPSYIKKRYVLEAISRHMGFSDLSDSESYNYSNFLQNPLVVLIQLADETAAQWYNL
ncbi:MAG: hypothetical protein K6G00_02370 [Treponema sp.]|nr:hypothetical protein [Treponema sp.]